jgi:hypothetical protein
MTQQAARRLGCAVILNAVQEFRQKGRNGGRPYSECSTRTADRLRARRFLEGPDLEFWAAVSELDPERIRVKVLTRTEGMADDETR